MLNLSIYSLPLMTIEYFSSIVTLHQQEKSYVRYIATYMSDNIYGSDAFIHVNRPASMATHTPNTLGYSMIGTSITGGQQQWMELMSIAQMRSWRHS